MLGFSKRRSFYGSLRKLYPNLTDDELLALEYFITNISVGEIIAVRELEDLVGIKDPRSVLDSLIEKGFIERGERCYNLSRNVKEELRKLGLLGKRRF